MNLKLLKKLADVLLNISQSQVIKKDGCCIIKYK